mmetsp:Transcript_22805/g.32829  ORF Transcript_22805/g.32829 Transcript_22805/m.32829 type:complete len:408 (-) Transcript_22805:299-1522(-)
MGGGSSEGILEAGGVVMTPRTGKRAWNRERLRRMNKPPIRVVILLFAICLIAYRTLWSTGTMMTSFYEASDPSNSAHLGSEVDEFKGIKLADHMADYEDYQRERKTPESPQEGGYGYNMKAIDDGDDEYYDEDDEDDDNDQDPYYEGKDEEDEEEEQQDDTAAEEDDADAVDSGYYADSQEKDEAEGVDMDGKYDGESENVQTGLGTHTSSDGAATTSVNDSDVDEDGYYESDGEDEDEDEESYGQDEEPEDNPDSGVGEDALNDESEDSEDIEAGEDDLEGDEGYEDEGYEGEEREYEGGEDEGDATEGEDDVQGADEGEEDIIDSAEVGDAVDKDESPVSFVTAAHQLPEDDEGTGANDIGAINEVMQVESADDVVHGGLEPGYDAGGDTRNPAFSSTDMHAGAV